MATREDTNLAIDIVFGCEGRVCAMDADGSHVEVLVSAPGTELNHFDWGVSPT